AVAVAVACPESDRGHAHASRSRRHASPHRWKVPFGGGGERVRLASRQTAERKAPINRRDDRDVARRRGDRRASIRRSPFKKDRPRNASSIRSLGSGCRRSRSGGGGPGCGGGWS